jgi:zinc transport system substrate-binding protein
MQFIWSAMHKTQRKRFCILLCVLVTALSFIHQVSCTQTPQNVTEKPVVVTGLPPYAWIVERLAGDFAEVRSLLGSDQNPHTFEPSPSQMSAVGKAVIFIIAGIPFERRITSKLSSQNSLLTIVDVSVSAGAQDHRDLHIDHADDPHIWMSPPLLIQQVGTITEALVQAFPEKEAVLRGNHDVLVAEIEAVHRDIGALLTDYNGSTFYVYHPAFGYFAEAYDLHQKAIEVGGEVPSARYLVNLVDRAKEDGVKVIFVQPQFDPAGAQRIAEAIDGVVVPLDPLDADVLSSYRRIAEALHDAFNSPGGE